MGLWYEISILHRITLGIVLHRNTYAGHTLNKWLNRCLYCGIYWTSYFVRLICLRICLGLNIL